MEDRFDAITAVMRGGPPLRLAVVFGSVATGRVTATSDLDIAIIPVDPAITLMEEGQLAAGFEGPVDVVRLDLASTFLRWQVARNVCSSFAT